MGTWQPTVRVVTASLLNSYSMHIPAQDQAENSMDLLQAHPPIPASRFLTSYTHAPALPSLWDR
jgi:hypothetical protein